MRENVPLLKCNGVGGGSDAIQGDLFRPKGGAGMFLAYGDLRAGSTNAGCCNGVNPGGRHFSCVAKPPEGTVQWSLLDEENWLGRWPKEPVQLSVVLGLPLQNLWIGVSPR
jgi:hypothetical protein